MCCFTRRFHQALRAYTSRSARGISRLVCKKTFGHFMRVANFAHEEVSHLQISSRLFENMSRSLRLAVQIKSGWELCSVGVADTAEITPPTGFVTRPSESSWVCCPLCPYSLRRFRLGGGCLACICLTATKSCYGIDSLHKSNIMIL